ncbi:MAG: site-specific integrase [Clostridium sp.]|nr:site-specific integrase [Clostridium sp.]
MANRVMKENGLKVSFYLKKSEMTDDGLCPVMGRINVGRYSEAAFSAKLTASPKAWMLGRATGKSMASQQINRRLDEIRAAALSVYQELSAVHMRVSAEDVKCHIQGMASGQETLLDYFDKFLANFAKRVGVNRVLKTLKAYRYSRKCLSEFLTSEYQLSDIPFTAIDRSFIDRYDLYLRTGRKLAVSTVAFHIVRLKMIVSEAITDGIITANPFAGFEVEKAKRGRRHLSSDELQRLMTTPLHESRLYLVRDLFLFSCYTGIPYGDLCLLTEENLEAAEDGTVWIKSSRKKTKVDYEIPLLEIPLRIIEKYRGVASGGKLLPMYSNSTLNLHLKRIAEICGIECRLVFHCGRHTYATEVTLAHGVPLETVSRMLGHNRITTTQIYAKVTDDKINTDTVNLDGRIASRFSVSI